MTNEEQIAVNNRVRAAIEYSQRRDKSFLHKRLNAISFGRAKGFDREFELEPDALLELLLTADWKPAAFDAFENGHFRQIPNHFFRANIPGKLGFGRIKQLDESVKFQTIQHKDDLIKSFKSYHLVAKDHPWLDTSIATLVLAWMGESDKHQETVYSILPGPVHFVDNRSFDHKLPTELTWKEALELGFEFASLG